MYIYIYYNNLYIIYYIYVYPGCQEPSVFRGACRCNLSPGRLELLLWLGVCAEERRPWLRDGRKRCRWWLVISEATRPPLRKSLTKIHTYIYIYIYVDICIYICIYIYMYMYMCIIWICIFRSYWSLVYFCKMSWLIILWNEDPGQGKFWGISVRGPFFKAQLANLGNTSIICLAWLNPNIQWYLYIYILYIYYIYIYIYIYIYYIDIYIYPVDRYIYIYLYKIATRPLLFYRPYSIWFCVWHPHKNQIKWNIFKMMSQNDKTILEYAISEMSPGDAQICIFWKNGWIICLCIHNSVGKRLLFFYCARSWDDGLDRWRCLHGRHVHLLRLGWAPIGPPLDLTLTVMPRWNTMEDPLLPCCETRI